MTLSKETLKGIHKEGIIVPDEAHFNLPEKVLQFGTGVLLRGLPDYFVNKANRMGIFNGRIAVVKSTSKGGTAEFDEQDGLYTICVRGLENGTNVEENIISSSISRVLSADKEFENILEIGRQKELKLIVSNTTEVGIQLVLESIEQNPPVSFPGKLLAVLYARFQALGNDQEADLAVIATELIPENGKKLETIVLELAAHNNLDNSFVQWLKGHIHFCNSLVDRIVPGKPDAAALVKMETELGYTDQLLIMAEPYRLWAIEGGERVSELLGLEAADAGLIVKPDIEIYRELKVRLLNGSHTLASGISFLSGISTVANAMTQDSVRKYISTVMHAEIVPAIPYAVDEKEAIDFSNTVIDRFANPYIEHLWINITFQYTMKVKIRLLPVLFQYYKNFSKVPASIAFGFAAYLHFMRVSRKSDTQYFGEYLENEYLITDDKAAYFYEKSQQPDATYVTEVLADQGLWEADLSALAGFIDAVEADYQQIKKYGMVQALNQLNDKL